MPRNAPFEKGGVQVLFTPCHDCEQQIPVVRQFSIQGSLRFMGVAVHFALDKGRRSSPSVALGYVDVRGVLRERTRTIAQRTTEPFAEVWQGLFLDLFGTALLSVTNEELTEPFRPAPRAQWNEREPLTDGEEIHRLVQDQLIGGRRSLAGLTKSDDIAKVLRREVLDLSRLGYVAKPAKSRVDGFHCTADADIVYTHHRKSRSIAVEVKYREDDNWPPVHQPVTNFFHHDLVLHIRVNGQSRAGKSSSAAVKRLLDGLKRVKFLAV